MGNKRACLSLGFPRYHPPGTSGVGLQRYVRVIAMIEMLAHSAVWGFGSSFGRDAYRKVKNVSLMTIFWACILALLFLTIWGYRGLARNIDNRAQSNLGWRIIGSIVAVMLGTATTYVVFNIYTHEHPRWDRLYLENSGWAVQIYLVLAFLGIVWGIFKKRKDHKEFDLEVDNINFLNDQGLIDSPFDTDLIEDEDGNKLRVKEVRDGAIVFTVIGKRSLRALITLDNDGRMVEYSGVVQL